MKKLAISRGFTLIELLMVIAIIAILSAVILTSLSGARAKSRDAKRVSDVSQIQLALEQYFDRCGRYPTEITDTGNPAGDTGCPTGVYFGTFISKIPTPPSNAAAYDYLTGGASASVPTDYILHVTLEGSTDALKDSLTDTYKGNFRLTYASGLGGSGVNLNFNCYTGVAGSTDYCLGPK